MLRFRVHSAQAASSFDLLAVSHVIDDAMQPGHFFVAPDLPLTWTAARSESIAWEIFRGRLLDATQTRQVQTFLSWHVEQHGEPLISVKLDIYSGQVHVTRGLQCHVWEGYDAGGGVIDSREAVKWTRELVGTIRLDRCADLEELRDELICLLWQAVVGTSRLPLTSVEAPLPAFVFGQLHYLYQPDAKEQATSSWEDWLTRGFQTPIAWRETVKLIEFVLRRVTSAELPRLTEFATGAIHELPRLLRALFNDVSLSPYTGFVENTLAWIELCVISGALSIEQHIDFLSYLLRQLGRHLTAYDLVTFHHRGANYPDALLLDSVLKAYVRVLEATPDLFTGSDPKAVLRRRALRQGCLVRRHYEGHPVPDTPTSPGENVRVMPSPHQRVPEEQLTQPHRRRRKLFADNPLSSLLSEPARRIFAQSILDLEQLAERTELGLGVFIDRPLGYAKEIAEPDLTPLLAHEAFSPSLARRRAEELQRLCQSLDVPWPAMLGTRFAQETWPDGLPHTQLVDSVRPVAALVDVRRVADDFVILRTLKNGLREFWELFDWNFILNNFRLRFLVEGKPRWCVQMLNEQKQPVLAVADAAGRCRLELCIDASPGYVTRAGVELPLAGLQLITVWEDTDDPSVLKRHDLKAACHLPWRGRDQAPSAPK